MGGCSASLASLAKSRRWPAREGPTPGTRVRRTATVAAEGCGGGRIARGARHGQEIGGVGGTRTCSTHCRSRQMAVKVGCALTCAREVIHVRLAVLLPSELPCPPSESGCLF